MKTIPNESGGKMFNFYFPNTQNDLLYNLCENQLNTCGSMLVISSFKVKLNFFHFFNNEIQMVMYFSYPLVLPIEYCS